MKLEKKRQCILTLLPDTKPAKVIDIDNQGVPSIEIIDALTLVIKKLMDDIMDEYLKDRGFTDISQVDASDYDEYLNFLRKNQIG